jgi:hypothetical protein
MGQPRQGTNQFQYLVESCCRALGNGTPPDPEDFRQLMTQIQQNVQANAPGGNWLTHGGAVASGKAAPSGVQFSVTGSNGVYQATITNPSGAQGGTTWHEISYGPLKSFTQTVTTMPPTAGNSVSVNAPGTSYFFRLRSSFDLQNWSAYQPASSTAIDAGKVSSAATVDAGAFNQTNYGVVTSAAVGSTAEVYVQGANGPLTNMVAQKGPAQISLPAATIAGVTPGGDYFVGWTGSRYILRETLADILAQDDVTPIGKVSVVNAGTPTLPTIVPIISDGHVVGFNVTYGGIGAVATYTLTFGSVGGGTGATFGAQTIENGVLISIAPGNPGDTYSGGTTVTASGGGVSPGTEGGGTALGGNGGRLTAV